MATTPTAKLINGDTINITAHPTSFRVWWSATQSRWTTMSAAKYCDQRRAFGVYVIDGPQDCVAEVWRAVPDAWKDNARRPAAV